MSYDWYCYRGKSEVPDVKEADSIIEAIQAAEESGELGLPNADLKERLAAALLEHNPGLQRFAVG